MTTAMVSDRETDHPLGPLRVPGASGGLMEVFRRRYLLKLLVRKELRVRYQGSVIGLGWSYVQPLVRFAMYYYIIGLIMTNRTPGRALLIFSGLVMVQFASNCLGQGSKAIIKNKSLVRKINLPREMFPVSNVAVSLYHMLPMYVILLIGVVINGWHPDGWAVLAIFLGLAIAIVWGLATALVLSAANVFYRDTQNIADLVNVVLRWVVPMIYPFGLIMQHAQGREFLYQIYLLNPLTSAVLLADRAFWIPSMANPAKVAAANLPSHLFERSFLMLLAGLVALGLAQLLFSRLEGRFAEQL